MERRRDDVYDTVGYVSLGLRGEDWGTVIDIRQRTDALEILKQKPRLLNLIHSWRQQEARLTGISSHLAWVLQCSYMNSALSCLYIIAYASE